MSQSKVLLFIDNSNIYVSATHLADKREGSGVGKFIRIDFVKLVELALAGRQILKAFAVGSIPPQHDEVWARLKRATGVDPELYERGGLTHGEQGLDQCLQVHMLRAATDYSEPHVAVLLTGDGAGYDNGVGFHADIERLHKAGWGIEVLSWRSTCAKALREWAEKNGVFVDLEQFYKEVTFIEKGRRSAPIPANPRPLATPRPSPVEQARKAAEQQAQTELAALRKKVADLEAAELKKAAAKAKYDRQFARNKKS